MGCHFLKDVSCKCVFLHVWHSYTAYLDLFCNDLNGQKVLMIEC